jgi:hypothetical protein
VAEEEGDREDDQEDLGEHEDDQADPETDADFVFEAHFLHRFGDYREPAAVAFDGRR